MHRFGAMLGEDDPGKRHDVGIALVAVTVAASWPLLIGVATAAAGAAGLHGFEASAAVVMTAAYAGPFVALLPATPWLARAHLAGERHVWATAALALWALFWSATIWTLAATDMYHPMSVVFFAFVLGPTTIAAALLTGLLARIPVRTRPSGARD